MSEPILDQTAERIAEHVRTHALDDIQVTFHGGEPLLAGEATFRYAVRAIRTALPPDTRVDWSVQTNGLLLSAQFIETLAELGVKIGISIDGLGQSHDRHRRFANGKGSYLPVVRAIEDLRAGPHVGLLAGLLCTIDVTADPLATYQALEALGPPSIDFLLPHRNWDTPPAQLLPNGRYADWLITIFDHWYGEPDGQTGVRIFEEIIQLCLGGGSRTETVGLSPAAILIIETDGQLEQVDVLKSAYHGAPETGLNVFDHAYDQALRHPSILTRQLGVLGLDASCRKCSVVQICGGGFYPHRYRTGSGFQNPSVYCVELFQLITHIRDRVWADLDLTGESGALRGATTA